MYKKYLSDVELLNWVRLARSATVGPMTFFALLQTYRDPINAIDKLQYYSDSRKYKIQLASLTEVEKELDLLHKFGGVVVPFCDNKYPEILSYISDPPPMIVCKGNTSFLSKKTVAVVGSRNATFNGCGLARKFALGLCSEEFVIVSGLARGIDRAAHKACLDNNFPTIAVLGSGINIIYPFANKDIYIRIKNDGLLVTEFPFGEKPKPSNFPRRNRIISGLSQGVLVVEAIKKSGALVTASHALDQGREVFAIPGSPSAFNSIGTNSLIKQGAKLVESVFDIVDELKFSYPSQHKHCYVFDSFKKEFLSCNVSIKEQDVEYAKKIILEKIDCNPVIIENIAIEIETNIRIVLIAILELELEEKIMRVALNKVCKIIP